MYKIKLRLDGRLACKADREGASMTLKSWRICGMRPRTQGYSKHWQVRVDWTNVPLQSSVGRSETTYRTEESVCRPPIRLTGTQDPELRKNLKKKKTLQIIQLRNERGPNSTFSKSRYLSDWQLRSIQHHWSTGQSQSKPRWALSHAG